MGNRYGAITAIGGKNSLHTVKFTVMFITLQGTYHFFYKIIDIKKFKFHTGIIHLYIKVVGNVVTECGNRAVIIWTTPFAEKIRKTIYQYFSTCFSTVLKEQLLTR